MHTFHDTRCNLRLLHQTFKRKPSLIYGYSLTNHNYYITRPDNRFLQISNYQNCLSDFIKFKLANEKYFNAKENRNVAVHILGIKGSFVTKINELFELQKYDQNLTMN